MPLAENEHDTVKSLRANLYSSHMLRNQKDLGSVLVLPSPGCVTVGKPPHLSVSVCKVEIIIIIVAMAEALVYGLQEALSVTHSAKLLAQARDQKTEQTSIAKRKKEKR